MKKLPDSSTSLRPNKFARPRPATLHHPAVKRSSLEDFDAPPCSPAMVWLIILAIIAITLTAGFLLWQKMN